MRIIVPSKIMQTTYLHERKILYSLIADNEAIALQEIARKQEAGVLEMPFQYVDERANNFTQSPKPVQHYPWDIMLHLDTDSKGNIVWGDDVTPVSRKEMADGLSLLDWQEVESSETYGGLQRYVVALRPHLDLNYPNAKGYQVKSLMPFREWLRLIQEYEAPEYPYTLCKSSVSSTASLLMNRYILPEWGEFYSPLFTASVECAIEQFLLKSMRTDYFAPKCRLTTGKVFEKNTYKVATLLPRYPIVVEEPVTVILHEAQRGAGLWKITAIMPSEMYNAGVAFAKRYR